MRSRLLLTAAFLLSGAADESNASQQDEFLPSRSTSPDIFAVVPIRTDENSVGGFQILENRLLADERDEVTDYGISLLKDGHSFEFDKNDIAKLYYRSTQTTFAPDRPKARWSCPEAYFSIELGDGTIESIDTLEGEADAYPDVTDLSVKTVEVVEALGKQSTRETIKPVEVWGLATNKSDAREIVEHYEQRLKESTYHYFKIRPGEGEVRNNGEDEVRIRYETDTDITQPDKGNIITGAKARRGTHEARLSVNGSRIRWENNTMEHRHSYHTRAGRRTIWEWRDAGWEDGSIDARHVMAYIRIGREHSEFWIGLPQDDPNLRIVQNVMVPKCW